MALDFVKASQPQISWLDGQLQNLKYKTRLKDKLKDTINEEREEIETEGEGKYLRVGTIPNGSNNIRTTTLIASCHICTTTCAGTNPKADPYNSLTDPYNINYNST